MFGLCQIFVEILVLRRRPGHCAALVYFFYEPYLDGKKKCPNH
jgi:hypothetical protein